MDKYAKILQKINEVLFILRIVSNDLSEISKASRSFGEEPSAEPKRLWFDDIIERCPECGKVSCHHTRPRLSSPWAIY